MVDLFAEMSEDEYHSRPFITSHKLSLFIRSPKMFINKHLGRDDIKYSQRSVSGMRFGSVMHALFLTGEKAFLERYTLTNEQGKIPVSEDDYSLCLRMVQALNNNPQATHLVQKCKHVETVFSTEILGLQCQSRIDMISSDCRTIVDLKTISDLSYADILPLEYVVQAAFYTLMMRELFRVTPDFYFLFIEKKPSHQVYIKYFTADMREKYVPMVVHALLYLKQMLDRYHDDPDQWPDVFVSKGELL